MKNTSNETYFKDASQWRYQMYESQKIWLSRALLGCMILAVLLGISLASNVLLFPLKKTVPFLYTVNETTGELTALGAIENNHYAADNLMTRFLLIRYVVNREAYDADNLDEPYQVAWAMSSPSLAETYAETVRTDDPKSPYALYGKRKYITVHVLSVHLLNKDTAMVRFEQTIHDRTSDHTDTFQKEAIIRWQYTQPSTTLKMLDRDPLGFKVIYYQTTQVNFEETS